MIRPFLASMFLMGCSPVHRQLKFITPEQMAMEHQPSKGLIEAEIENRDTTHFPEGTPLESRDGRAFVRPTVLGNRDTLVLSSHQDDVELRILVRGNGLFERHDFRRIHTITGSLDRRYANEVVLLNEDLNRPVRLSMRDLSNPYNNYGLDHDDLMMVVADREGHQERMLFKRRVSGLHVRLFAGLLATIPLTEESQGVAPILAAGPTFGWRTSNISGPMLMLDNIELVVSLGLGSTALQTVALEEDRVGGLFNAALVGGGIRMFRIVSVQGFVNTSQFFRNASEAPATLAIGVDAAALAAITRDIFIRLFQENPLRERQAR